MNKFVKIICVLVTLSMIMMVGGCSKSKVSKDNNSDTANTVKDNGNDKQKDEVTKLKLVTISTDETRVNIMENYIKPNSEKELPNFKIEFEPGGGGEDLANKMKTYNAAGDLPDVWYSEASYAPPIIEVGNQLDLTPYITKDGFIDKYSVKDALKFKDGKIYALSSGSDTFFTPRIFYNKKIFQENGIEIPETFDELIEVCKTLRSKDIVPVTTMGKGGWAPQLYLFQTMVQIEDPEVMKQLLSNEIDFTNPVIKNGLARIEELAKVGAFPKGIATLDYGPAKEMFVSGKAAMYWMFTWELPSLSEDPNVDFFPWPSDGSKYNRNNVVQYWGSPLGGYAVSATSENIEEAVKLAEFCAMQDAKYFNSQNAPVTLDTGNEITGVSELMSRNLDHFNNAETKIASFMTNAMDAKTSAEFASYGAMLLTGDYSAEQFVKDFNKIWLENTWFDK